MTSMDERNNEEACDSVAFVVMDLGLNCTDYERWLLDSGASNHMTSTKQAFMISRNVTNMFGLAMAVI